MEDCDTTYTADNTGDWLANGREVEMIVADEDGTFNPEAIGDFDEPSYAEEAAHCRNCYYDLLAAVELYGRVHDIISEAVESGESRLTGYFRMEIPEADRATLADLLAELAAMQTAIAKARQ